MTADEAARKVNYAEKFPKEVCKAIDRFVAFMEAQDIGPYAAARVLGINQATLSKMLNRKYPGDTKRIARNMTRAIRQHEERKHAPKRPPFVDKTSVAETVNEVLSVAHIEGIIAAILGPTGIGKTMAAKAYCEAEPMATYFCAGWTCTKHALLEKLAAQFAKKANRRRASVMLEAIAESLQDTGRLLVIDEIDPLATFAAEDALQVLREIHDIAHMGMVVIGTDGFLAKLQKRNSPTINQFLGRTAYVEYLKPTTHHDLELIAKPYHLDVAAMKELERVAEGQAQRAVNALIRAQRAAGSKLTAKAIARAGTKLMPVMHNGFNGLS